MKGNTNMWSINLLENTADYFNNRYNKENGIGLFYQAVWDIDKSSFDNDEYYE